MDFNDTLSEQEVIELFDRVSIVECKKHSSEDLNLIEHLIEEGFEFKKSNTHSKVSCIRVKNDNVILAVGNNVLDAARRAFFKSIFVDGKVDYLGPGARLLRSQKKISAK